MRDPRSKGVKAYNYKYIKLKQQFYKQMLTLTDIKRYKIYF